LITETKTRKLENGITVVEISGRLNLGNSLLGIESGMKRLIETGARKLIVDLSDVNYIDSSGIGMLVGCAGQLEQSSGRMRIAGASGAVAKAFGIVHMERIAPLDATVEEAVAGFSQSAESAAP
jgi:anti-sigma B factor antagonist